MVKVRALSKGYVGGVIRELGEVFEWPEGDKVGSWVKPVAFAGKGDHDGDGLTGGSKPQEGDDSKTKKGKGKGKAETVDAPAAKPFEDAPAPEVAGNGVQEALGGPAPDWLPPSETGDDGKPVMAED